MADGWTEDGHVLIVEPDGPAPEEGDLSYRVECPGDHGGKCKGPFVACDECYGTGYTHDDEDDEIPCAACDETGRDGGKHTCWLVEFGMEDGLPENDGNLTGRFKLEYQSDGVYDDFRTYLRRGERVPREAATDA